MPVIITGNNTPTAGGVTYGDGSTYVNTAAGAAGGVLYSAGSNAPAFSAAGSAGGILYSAGASAPAFSVAGTSGQLLQSNGASAPTWVAPPGNYTLLTSGSISNGTTNVDIETGFTDATYPEIVIVFSNCKSVSGSGYFTSQFKLGGSYNTSANYAISKFAAGETVQNLTGQTQMLMGFAGVRTPEGADSVFIVKNRFQRQTGAGVITCLMPKTDNGNQIGMWWGYISATGDIQGVRFFITSSTVNFASGTYAVYGFKYA